MAVPYLLPSRPKQLLPPCIYTECARASYPDLTGEYMLAGRDPIVGTVHMSFTYELDRQVAYLGIGGGDRHP